jgi:EAL domain-containing protein (putative c-di-GMP-specific phosphodiesterase class I)
MVVVAEGAEAKDQVSALREMACAEAQGYYFGRPMSAADFAAIDGPGDGRRD